MSTRSFVPLCAALLAVAALQTAQAQPPAAPPVDPFKDVPESSWAYGAVADLNKILFPPRPEGYGGYGGDPTSLHRRKMNRFEFAVVIARTMDRLLPAQKVSGRQMPATPSLTSKGLDILQRLTDEFSIELKSLGIDLTDVNQRLDTLRSVAPPFPDVPARHWAAPSVEVVRKAEIIMGYPSGRFKEHP